MVSNIGTCFVLPVFDMGVEVCNLGKGAPFSPVGGGNVVDVLLDVDGVEVGGFVAVGKAVASVCPFESPMSGAVGPVESEVRRLVGPASGGVGSPSKLMLIILVR
jgi:hypothetical protein